MKTEKNLEVGDVLNLTTGMLVKFRGMTLLALGPTSLRIEALDYHDPPAEKAKT